ncbi:hypothetical protein fHeYen902_025c [Yersinia phage fHe-Yen9-02]|nr:hypothetical protein fHeYen902_025c [Yersinia phage fHe-Yen9-02]
MYTREKYRTLSRTMVVDTRVREVTAMQNNVIRRQSQSVGISEQAITQSTTVVVGPKGVSLPATLGLLYVDTAEPIIMQIGGAQMIIEGQFVLTGKLDPVVLVSDVEQRVNVFQY